MAEAKPFASLSSGLLARKGDARPAMRRQLNNGTVEHNAVAHDDLGWNDMGYDVDPDHNVPMDHDHDMGHNPLAAAVPEVKPEVKAQQDRIAEHLHVQAEQTEALHFDAPSAPIVSIVTAKPVVAAPVAIAAVAPKAKTPRAEPGMKAKSALRCVWMATAICACDLLALSATVPRNSWSQPRLMPLSNRCRKLALSQPSFHPKNPRTVTETEVMS